MKLNLLFIPGNAWKNSLLLFSFLYFVTIQKTAAQCTTATVNWDNLDYLHSFGTYGVNNPVTGQSFVSSTMRQIQTFAIGTNSMTINTAMQVNNNGTLSGEVLTHTGDVAGFTGADVHFVPTAGQTITITFLNEVTNAGFTLYDVDRNSVYTITAANASSTAQTIAVATYAATPTVGGTPTSVTLTAGSTNLGYTSNAGTATMTIAGPVKTIVITATAIGANAEIFLSDITACVLAPGFPTNYYQPYTEPFTGQPAYFLANPQNLHVYMVNAATAEATYLFSDPGITGNKMNSLAYDPINHYLYYVMDNAPLPNGAFGNWALKKYDFNTDMISTVLPDIRTLLIPTFEQGVEYAGASFYNGSLYLGIEGSDGFTYTTNGESVIWKIDFDGTGTPIRGSQVFATPGDDGGGTVMHDWGDFIIKDGTIITHATTTNSNTNHYIHVSMQNNTTVAYAGNGETAGQLSLTYNGNAYRVKNNVALYNNNGTIGSTTPIAVNSCSPAWTGNAGDASDPFKPKCDFGDAPSTYDPVALSPAANQQACNNSTLRIGSTWDREWNLASSTDATADGTDEDGIATVTVMVSDGIPYNHVQEVTVLNDTGAPAYLAGWLDYNANGLFDASEGAVVTVPSSGSPQTISLGWTNITVAPGTPNTFLRVRLYSGTLTANDATGWLSDGETEDYPVLSQSMPLAIQLLDFNATLTRDKNVLLTWNVYTDSDALGFEVERSRDKNVWEKIAWVDINTSVFTSDYSLLDQQPALGKSYYRLKMVEKSASSRFSSVRLIQIDQLHSNFKIYPNPVKSYATVSFNSTANQSATLFLRSMAGELMIKKSIVLNEGDNRIQFAVDGLSNGLYIVELVIPGKTFINKLTVTH